MATKDKSQSGRLTEIVKYRRSQGGSVTGSLAGGIKERLKEKFDPRQLINQKGLMTALFPGLKTYQSKTVASEISKSSMQSSSFEEIKPILETISFNTKMTAKSTMVLPALHRDVNVIRQNIVKLVKMKGGDARTKADMYFVKAKDREDKYERELNRERNKKNKIEKLKEDEEKKSKGFLGKIFSTIISGLELVVKSILALGKAILGAFKFLAGIIVDVLTGITKFLLSSLMLLLPNLKSILTEIFKFISNNFLTIIVRSLIGSLLRYLLMPKMLFRIGGGLLGFFAAAFGLSILPDVRRKYGQLQDPKMDDKMVYDQMMKERDIYAKGQQLPTTQKTLVGDELKLASELGLAPEGANKAIIGGNEGKAMNLDYTGQGLTELQKNMLSSRFDEDILKDFYDKKRSLYGLYIPGFNGIHNFLLTEEEATSYGNQLRDYVSMLRKVIELQNSGSTNNQNRIQKIKQQMDIVKNEMLTDVTGMVIEQIKNGNEIKKDYIQNISNIRMKKNPTFSETYIDRFTESVMESDAMKVLQKTFSKNLESSSTKFIEDLNLPNIQLAISSSQKNFNEFSTEMKNKLQERTNQLYASDIIDKTYDNRRQSVVFKQPIVINQESQNKTPSRAGGLGNPASAWNNDFIEKYFMDMTYNMTNFSRN
jgi:hypothetical protein